MNLFKQYEKRDPSEVLPSTLPEPFKYDSHRDFVRKVLHDEVNLRAVDGRFIDSTKEPESAATIEYRKHLNAKGSPSEIVAAGYAWLAGTEIAKRAS